MTYAKLTISRSHPNQIGPTAASQEGVVKLRLKDAAGQTTTIEVALGDWSRALGLHKPVTAWLYDDNPTEEAA